MRPRSLRMAALYRQRRALVIRLLAERPVCQRCHAARATDVHELVRRSQGGSILDLANLACLCRRCHVHVSEHPVAAEAEGWAVTRKRGGAA